MLISLREFADKWDLQPNSIRRRCRRGTIRSAVKIGRDWWIDDQELLIDYRTYPYCIDRRYGNDPEKKIVDTIEHYTIKTD